MPTPEGEVGLLHTFDLVTCMSLHAKGASQGSDVGISDIFCKLRPRPCMYLHECVPPEMQIFLFCSLILSLAKLILCKFKQLLFA